LERTEAEVDAEHVVGGAIGPRVGDRCMQLAVILVIELRVAGVDDASEVEPDHSGDPAEERESDQHVQRELELRLPDVIPVAEKARVAPAEAAQVVEAGEVEPPSEAATLRDAGRRARVDAAAADDAQRLDRVGLQIGEEAVLSARRQIASAESDEERGAADRAARSISRRIPSVGAVDLGLRIESTDLVQID